MVLKTFSSVAIGNCPTTTCLFKMTWTAVKIWRRDSAAGFYRLLFTTGDNGYWKERYTFPRRVFSLRNFSLFLLRLLRNPFRLLQNLLQHHGSDFGFHLITDYFLYPCSLKEARLQHSTLIKMMCHFRQRRAFLSIQSKNSLIVPGFIGRKFVKGVKIDADCLL